MRNKMPKTANPAIRATVRKILSSRDRSLGTVMGRGSVSGAGCVDERLVEDVRRHGRWSISGDSPAH